MPLKKQFAFGAITNRRFFDSMGRSTEMRPVGSAGLGRRSEPPCMPMGLLRPGRWCEPRKTAVYPEIAMQVEPRGSTSDN